VGVRDGKIAAVGVLAGHPAQRTIDARGLVVAPGFIDLLGQSEYTILVDKRAASKITQGITTEVTGEGVSIAPLNDAMLAEGSDQYDRYGFTPDFTTLDGYFRTLERRGSAINLATFVGAGGVRDLVIGKTNRRTTPEELKRMSAIVDQAMREGALGVSSSLQYVPDMYNSTEDLIALAKVAARPKAIDGPFANETSHPRGWGSAARILGYYVRDEKVLRLEEAIRKMTSFAAEAAGIPDRGLLKVGFAADLTLFDPQTVNARATFEKPNQYSEGIPYVAVNGVLVVDAGKITGATPGKALRGPGYRKP
jgi:N-acyl-D-aspartate/D-glutamate deacylase